MSIVFLLCDGQHERHGGGHSPLDTALTGHGVHCPACDAHLTSLLACPDCGVRYERGDVLMSQLRGTLMGKLREVEAERDRLRAALEAIRAEPYGCPFCDSGKLRPRATHHTDDCGYLLMERALRQPDAEGGAP